MSNDYQFTGYKQAFSDLGKALDHLFRQVIAYGMEKLARKLIKIVAKILVAAKKIGG